MAQIHKRFTDDQVKRMIERYLKSEIERKYIQSILGVGKSRFFKLVQEYREDPGEFSITYHRTTPSRIDPAIEKNILKELLVDKQAIQNKDIPLQCYNYSYVKERLLKKYVQTISLPTVIDRAKKHGFYLKTRMRKIHDREVITVMPENSFSMIPLTTCGRLLPKRSGI